MTEQASAVAPASTVLEAEGLGKRYGDRDALRGVSLSASRGELVAIIGPNGAGKTTLSSILAGIQSADLRHGQPQACRDRLGAPAGCRCTESSQWRRTCACSPASSASPILRRPSSGCSTSPGCASARATRLAVLSGGNRQRVNIAIGLLGEQPILLLDEPSAALDPRQRERVWEFVLSLAAGGTTVIYSTHNIQEAERHAQRVLVLADGELIFTGSPRELEDVVERERGGRGDDFEEAFVAFLRARGH